jgi:hypothetical protein
MERGTVGALACKEVKGALAAGQWFRAWNCHKDSFLQIARQKGVLPPYSTESADFRPDSSSNHQ